MQSRIVIQTNDAKGHKFGLPRNVSIQLWWGVQFEWSHIQDNSTTTVAVTGMWCYQMVNHYVAYMTGNVLREEMGTCLFSDNGIPHLFLIIQKRVALP